MSTKQRLTSLAKQLGAAERFGRLPALVASLPGTARVEFPGSYRERELQAIRSASAALELRRRKLFTNWAQDLAETYTEATLRASLDSFAAR